MLTLAAVGRGGQGDVGQRIRDEILYVQSRNNAKVLNSSTLSMRHWPPCDAVLTQLLMVCNT